MPPGPSRTRRRRGGTTAWHTRDLRHLGGLRGDRRRGSGAPGGASRTGSVPWGSFGRAELPGSCRIGATVECHLRAACATAWAGGVLVAERSARPRASGEGATARDRPFGVRVDRKQGRCLFERPARVLGGRSANRRGCPLPGVVRQSA